jgi:hypothetical protein
MAAHAIACGWNARVPAVFGSEMTILTGNLQVAGVLPMGESDGLLGLKTLLVAWERIAHQPANDYQRAYD